MLISELAARLGCQVIGEAAIEIAGVAPIESASADQVTFLNNIKYKRHLATTAAAAIILQKAEWLPAGKTGLISANPYLTFAQALRIFHPPKTAAPGVHPTASVSPLAKLGNNVSIGAYVVIEDHAELGDNVVLHPHCVIYEGAKIGADSLLYSHCVVREGCILGERVILQNHVTIGADGFGFVKQVDGSWYKIMQTGNVQIEDDVEIGAGSTIDRATIGTTVIRRGVKLDNLVHIGHGSTVDENTLLCAQVGLSGTSHVGKNVILAGQVGVAGHLTIGDHVFATAQAGIPSSIEAGRQIAGSPAMDKRDWLRTSGAILKLPQALKEIRALEERLAVLEKQAGVATPINTSSEESFEVREEA
jgi:UDP-3-O-[3-hydroxymyristoyl] glucosamine N-acyltransferase